MAFVRVSADGTAFQLGGRPWRFAGVNCYYLMTRAADPALRHEAATALDDAAAAGLTALRTWAFADGTAQWNALQPKPGVFDERVFRALDWVVAEAGRRGLRLKLVLTNYWEDYGGMRCYVEWSCQQRGLAAPAAEAGGTCRAPGAKEPCAEEFYTDPICRAMFRTYMAALVGRANTITGVAYRDEPAILGWSLANEPRCAGDAAATTVAAWAHDMAGFLKSLDPNHLVCLDCEGFLGSATPSELCHNPYRRGTPGCAGSGCDFWRESSSPHLDFACCHLYPDLWLPQAGEEERAAFSSRWLACHLRVAAALRKPLVLSEFGKLCTGAAACQPQQASAAPPLPAEDGGTCEARTPSAAAGPGPAASPAEAGRARFYRGLLGEALAAMRHSKPLGGTLYWMLAAPSYPDYDGFTIYLSGSEAPSGHSTAAMAAVGASADAAPGGGALRALAQRGGGTGVGRGWPSVTAAAIVRHAADVAALNAGPAAGTPSGSTAGAAISGAGSTGAT
eukprot:scaffold22.g6108.t1